MQITSNTRYLLDTNILIYSVDSASPFHTKAKETILQIKDKQAEGVVAQQNILEFSHVLMRTYGISPTEVVEDSKAILEDFSLITPLPSTLPLFLSFVEETNKKNVVHDLYLAATMLDNGISTIITANEQDFLSIPGISVYNPWAMKD